MVEVLGRRPAPGVAIGSPGRRPISVGWSSVGCSAVAAAGSPGGAAARAGPYRGRVRDLRTQW